MRIHSSIRRRCAALVMAGTAAAACDLRNPATPTPAARQVSAASTASADGFAVNGELAAVRQATARFHVLRAAEQAGYTIENEPCVSSPAGGMGIHAPNIDLALDPALDPAKPELLLYEPQPGGGHRLVGVEYFQAVILRNKETQEVGPRLDRTPWDPEKFEVVNPAPELFGQHFHLTPPPADHVPWHYALHVWVWAHNPSGLFADWNPTVHCPGAASGR